MKCETVVVVVVARTSRRSAGLRSAKASRRPSISRGHDGGTSFHLDFATTPPQPRQTMR